jgi:hypothetical protein
MEKNPDNLPGNDHDLPPSDEVTRNKIDKHLSDINDTISEEDIKNINTTTGDENVPAKTHRPADEENQVDKKESNDDEPEKELPTPWEILS